MPHKMTKYNMRKLPPIKQKTQTQKGYRRFKMFSDHITSSEGQNSSRIPKTKTIVAHRTSGFKDNTSKSHEESSAHESADQLEPLPFIDAEEIRQKRKSVDLCTHWLMKHYTRPNGLSPTKRLDQRRVTMSYRSPDRMRLKHIQSGNKARKKKSGIFDVDDDAEDDNDVFGIPKEPRFCATLSPEAQFAMMKGYDDKLSQSLGDGVVSKTPLPSIQRVTTPGDGQIVRLKTPADGYRGRMHMETDGNRTPGDGYQMITPSDGHRIKTPGDGHRLRWGRVRTDDRIKDKKLSVSKTFQLAMDLLDTVKISQGEMVTSPRNITDPANKYETWSRTWQREFTVISTK